MKKRIIEKFHNKTLQYILLALYGLMIATVLTGMGHMYGSKVDWISQHTVFPDIFREHFYETGEILPKFLFNVGAGQNAFNFAYYGFLSPIILLSYFFPFVDMVTYITVASIVLFLLTGILMKKFVSAHMGENIGFVAAIIILSAPPLNMHFHRHIMFVWYFPFLLLGLIGIDRYFRTKKPVLFTVSVVLLIFTNYLYAVPSLMCLYTYAVYKTFKEFDGAFEWKPFLKKAIICTFMFAIPVFISGILLVPTAQSLFSNRRPSESSIALMDLILPKIKEYFYDSYSIGITFTMFIATIGNLTCKKVKKSELFLNIALLMLLLFPPITYALNGFLYVRGKILIPFLVLYIYNLFVFIKNLQTKQVNVLVTVIITTVFGTIFCLGNGDTSTYPFFFIYVFLEIILMYAFSKKTEYIPVYTIIILVITCFVASRPNLTTEYFDSMYYDEVTSLTESISQDDYFRTDIAYREYENSNKLYSDKHYNTSVFSSTSNALYLNFYNEDIDNNSIHYCNLVMAGSRNEHFHTYMGTRYIVSQYDPGFLYEKIKEGKNLNLYENKNAYPIAYKSSDIMSEADFNKAEFPYSQAYLMNNTVISGDFKCDYTPEFEVIDTPSEYNFTNKEVVKKQIDLGEKYVGKYLYLTFTVDNSGEYENRNDLYIIINGKANLLSRANNIYYNANNKFEYVLPLEENAVLDIQTSKGKFNIKDVKMYTSDSLNRQYEAAKDFEINKKDNSFSCSVEAENGEYLVTTIPYDSNFKAYINGKEAELALVNKAFVGLKLQSGINNIEFRYKSTALLVGTVMSLAGLVMFAIFLFVGKLNKKRTDYTKAVE